LFHGIIASRAATLTPSSAFAASPAFHITVIVSASDSLYETGNAFGIVDSDPLRGSVFFQDSER
jgi:hypothetical protein